MEAPAADDGRLRFGSLDQEGGGGLQELVEGSVWEVEADGLLDVEIRFAGQEPGQDLVDLAV